MIIDNVATQANSLLIHHPDAITDFKIKNESGGIKRKKRLIKISNNYFTLIALKAK